jgi:hypothetical protein
MDLLGGEGGGGGGGGGCATPLALTRGGVIFHDKAKNIRDKIRYSNLSNNMMISELCTTITIQIQ